MTSTDDSASEDQLGPATAPENFGLTARGFVTEDEARAVGIAVRDCVLLFSRIFDLASPAHIPQKTLNFFEPPYRG